MIEIRPRVESGSVNGRV